jgi:hypothetical protein
MYSVTLASNLFFTGQQFFNKKAAGSSNLLPFFCIQNFFRITALGLNQIVL